MLRFQMSAVIVALGLVLGPSAVWAQEESGFVQGFGGFTFGDPETDLTFGGKAGMNLSPNIQLVGEVGYIRDVLPSAANLVNVVFPVGLTASAFTAEGGVRVVSPRGSALRGYGEVLAGAARVSTSVDLGLNGSLGFVQGIANEVLDMFDRTEPTLSVGGGLLVQGGSLFVDIGYRYTRIFGEPLGLALGSDGLNVSQVRVGVGVSF
jgi:opacity protein-like surface antigen